MSRQRNEHRDNVNFVQLNRGYLRLYGELAMRSPPAIRVLTFLVEHMGRLTNSCICSYTVMQELIGYSRPTIAKAIKILREENWIDTCKIGNLTAYSVNERFAWTAAKNQRQYAYFTSEVIASETEQESDFALKAKEDLKRIPIVDLRKERIIVKDELLPRPDQTDMELD